MEPFQHTDVILLLSRRSLGVLTKLGDSEFEPLIDDRASSTPCSAAVLVVRAGAAALAASLLILATPQRHSGDGDWEQDADVVPNEAPPETMMAVLALLQARVPPWTRLCHKCDTVDTVKLPCLRCSRQPCQPFCTSQPQSLFGGRATCCGAHAIHFATAVQACSFAKQPPACLVLCVCFFAHVCAPGVSA